MTRGRYQTGGFAEPLPLDTPPAWWSSSIRRSARAATTHMLHAISRPRSQKTAMMMITPIVFPPCIGDSRSLCRSFHMHHVRYRYGGDCEGVRCVGDVSFSFPNVVGREAWGPQGYEERKGRKKRPEQVRETLVWVSVVLFRPSVGWYRMFGCSGCGLAGLLMLEAVKTCEEGQTRPMPGSSGISAGSGGWSPGVGSSNPWAGCKPIMWGAATSL